jgi:hypothetical protein
MEVKRTLMRTSMRSGGATSTSSITSGSLGPHATAAAQSVMAGNGNIGKKKDSELKKKKMMMGKESVMAGNGNKGSLGIRKEPLHLMGFPWVLPPLEKPLVSMV